MNIETIIKTYCNEDSESKKANIRSWFARIKKMANDMPLEQAFASKDFLLNCFSSSKSNTVSRPQYVRIKEIISYILEYYNLDKSVIPSREEVLEASQMCGFFGT